MSSSYDLVVVGGGIVGASLAYHAVAAGAHTLLVDGRHPGQATAAGAGILSVETSANDTAPGQRFALAAARHYPRLVEALGEDRQTGYYRCGMLMVAVGDEQVSRFDAYHERLREHHRQRRSVASEPEEVDPEAARTRFPVLAPLARALFHPDAARVDGQRMRDALLEVAQRRGLALRYARVEQLRIEKRRVVALQADGDALACASLAIAAGAWSASFEGALGISIPVAPQRGQILHFEVLGADTAAWPVVGTLTDYYLVAWPGGRVVCGATRETGSGFDPRPTAAGVQEVLQHTLALAPGLADATLIETRVGLRPLTTDLLPILGAVPGLDNAYLATGHGPAGLTLGPYSGMCLSELILTGTSPFDLSPFRLDRPSLRSP